MRQICVKSNARAFLRTGQLCLISCYLATYSYAQADFSWLEQDWDCDQVVEQLHARYAPLGGLRKALINQADNLAIPLEILCGERFSHCNFSCPGLSTGHKITESRHLSAKISETVQHAALLVLEYLQRSFITERSKKIQLALEHELTNNLVWTKINLPEEQQANLPLQLNENSLDTKQDNEIELSPAKSTAPNSHINKSMKLITF